MRVSLTTAGGIMHHERPTLSAASEMSEMPPPHTPALRRTWVPVAGALLAMLHGILGWVGREPAILTGQDASVYIILARAIRSGTYRDIMFAGAPWHHMYPPGYPALLALWITIGGERFDWLIVLQVALSVATVALTFLAARRVLSDAAAIGILVLISISPALLAHAGMVGSEEALACCIAIAAWATTQPRTSRQVALLMAAALVAPLMRTPGVVLPAAVVLDWLLARRYRDAITLIVLAAIVVGGVFVWTAMNAVQIPGASYTADFAVRVGSPMPFWRVLLARIHANAVYYPRYALPELLSVKGIPNTSIDNVLVFGMLTAGLVVGAVAAWRIWRLAVLTLLMSGALFLVWPYQVDRYLVPILPTIVGVMLCGIQQIGRWRSPHVGQWLITAVVIVFAAFAATTVVPQLQATRGCTRGKAMPPAACLTPDDAAFFRAVVFVRDSLPPDARILAQKAATLSLYTGRISVPFNYIRTSDSAVFWTRVKADSTQYALLTNTYPVERAQLFELYRRRCADLQLVATFSESAYLFVLPWAPSATAFAKRPNGCAAVSQYRNELIRTGRYHPEHPDGSSPAASPER